MLDVCKIGRDVMQLAGVLSLPALDLPTVGIASGDLPNITFRDRD